MHGDVHTCTYHSLQHHLTYTTPIHTHTYILTYAHIWDAMSPLSDYPRATVFAQSLSSSSGGGGVGAIQRKNKRKADGSAAMPFSISLAAVDDTVDPNEPLYCTCRKVSYGKMVGCESDACKVEWFHYSCVGLADDAPEPEVWFCRVCRLELGMEVEPEPAEARDAAAAAAAAAADAVDTDANTDAGAGDCAASGMPFGVEG